MPLSRRHFLCAGAAAAVGPAVTACAALERIGMGEALTRAEPGLGPLLPDPRGVLDLPAGFAYREIGRLGSPMTDGLKTPARLDGMAAFAGPAGTTLLVRNHEMATSGATDAPGVEIPRALRYDPGNGAFVRGGTTNLVVDAQNRLVASYATLGGTVLNCAGGATPWGSWITCEETTVTPEADPRHAHRHGYCFEVPATASAPVAPVPLVAMGRFSHEAVAFDPATGIVYETEDARDLGWAPLYRFRPAEPGTLRAGGRLEALRLRAFAQGVDTARGFPRGVPFDGEWVEIRRPDPGEGELSCAAQGLEQGAAAFRRAEGAFFSRPEGALYFAATDGGAAGRGQLFRLTPGRDGTPDRLELFLEAEAPAAGETEPLWEWPDNLALAPWGDLVVCEDSPRAQHLVLVTRRGEVSRLARNALNATELAGICFAPNGRTLFVNIYGDDRRPGVTLAVTGPFASGVGASR